MASEFGSALTKIIGASKARKPFVTAGKGLIAAFPRKGSSVAAGARGSLGSLATTLQGAMKGFTGNKTPKGARSVFTAVRRLDRAALKQRGFPFNGQGGADTRQGRIKLAQMNQKGAVSALKKNNELARQATGGKKLPTNGPGSGRKYVMI